jgi:hypothetical protein
LISRSDWFVRLSFAADGRRVLQLGAQPLAPQRPAMRYLFSILMSNDAVLDYSRFQDLPQHRAIVQN